MKTLADCTRDDLGELAQGAYELLSASMFYYWVHGGEGDADQSWHGTMERMRAALKRCGFPHPPYEEFRRNVEAMLKSGKTPEEWAAARER